MSMSSAMQCAHMHMLVHALVAVLLLGSFRESTAKAEAQTMLYGFGEGDPVAPLFSCRDEFSKITSQSSTSVDSCRGKAQNDACTYLISLSQVKGCCAMDDGE